MSAEEEPIDLVAFDPSIASPEPKRSRPKKKRALPVLAPAFKQPSASNTEAFVMCGASHVLPQGDTDNDFRARGSEGHEPLAARINKRTPNTTPRGLDLVRDFPLETILGELDGHSVIEAEVAYAVNVKTKTVRRIGRDIGRNYGTLVPYEVPTTVDVCGLKKGLPWVRDWKFGKSASWWQVNVQAAALAYGSTPSETVADLVDGGFFFIEGETRGRIYHEEHRLISIDEIDQACDQIAAAWDRVSALAAAFAQGKIPPVAAGSWCTWCGAYKHCPEKWNLAKNLLGKLLSLSDGSTLLEALAPEEMGIAWTVAQEAKRMAYGIEDVLKELAEREPIPLPNGKRLEMVETSGRVTVDRDAVYKLVQRLGGTQSDFESVLKRGRSFLTAKEKNA